METARKASTRNALGSAAPMENVIEVIEEDEVLEGDEDGMAVIDELTSRPQRGRSSVAMIMICYSTWRELTGEALPFLKGASSPGLNASVVTHGAGCICSEAVCAWDQIRKTKT